MNPLIFLMIMMTMLSGTIITMLSSHWFTAWMGLEMNMFAIIPIIIKNHHPRSIEAATKYFLTQATASMLLMLAIMLNFLLSGQWSIISTPSSFTSFILVTALIMKLGMAPFHFWLPEVTQGTHLSSGLLILTWQKLAPFSILYQISNHINPTLLMTSAFLSILIGGWGGLNQTQLRKILAYSSIAHMGWMAMILIYNPTLTLLNLLIYITLTLSAFMLLIINYSTSTSSLSLLWNKTPLISLALMAILLSMGGLPPLSGFIPKWLIMQELTKNLNAILPFLMATLALLNLYFYMRLIYSSSLTIFPSMNNMKIKWQFNNHNIYPGISPIMLLSTMILPLTPMYMSLF
ncbi:NADH dehydrogenase subunit 2 (mitochondrion) [Orycteropus afer]|uniref:NADH-ubiquinone oxidoreductase chain 2 n=2 Tax=Orycteropus afer TaxID=9818 RepID=A0A8B6X0D9_ORYAF|nr:NADH dehydrogenase subunit 2 [Orycteropus afer]CAB41622.1 NADH dehydrogenase subunit 2 [Orycteropus afer]